MMKAICIDDEQLALEYLKRQIMKLNGIEVIGTFIHPIEGKEHILTEEVDVIFLDIHLPEINGIELAEQIINEKPDLIVVFVTAYDQYAVKAFELNALDYLVKPVKLDRLRLTLDRVRKQLNVKEEKKPELNHLQIKVSNYLSFQVEPDIFKPIPWRTSKTQELFLYLLQNHGKLVEKSTLMELLWEVYELEKGYSLLYTTVYNVRKALRPFNDHIVLHNTTDGYLLELKSVSIDLFEWEKSLTALPELNYSTVKSYEEVMRLNKEPYLLNHDYVWLEAERHRMESIWLKTANRIATFYEMNNEGNDAIKWYKNICERYQEHEEAHFSLMKLYAKIGDSKLVTKQYRNLTKVLAEELSIEPSNYIKEWYEQNIIRRVNNNHP